MTTADRRRSDDQAPAVVRAERGGTLGAGAAQWRGVARRTMSRIVRDRVSVAAGSLAYHLFLSFFPAVIAGLAFLTLLHVGSGTIRSLTHGIERGLPSGAAGVFTGAVRAATRRTSGSIASVVLGIAVALWSASSAMAVLQQTLDIAYEVPIDRSFVARRIRALPMLLLSVGLGGCAAVLVVFGQPIGSALRSAIPVGAGAVDIGWTVVRWTVAFVLASLLFSVYYYLGPNREKPRWQWVTAGGLLAAAAFLAASLGFSFYVSSFGAYGRTYGSFAGVAIFIFWLYLVGVAILVGAELNAEVERGDGRGSPAR
jgi:membrane protein